MDEYRKYEPVFGSWYLSRLIGKGSFGKVYEIVREEYGTTYRAALKIISVPQDDDDAKSRMTYDSDPESVSEYYEGILKDIINENEIMSKLKGNSNIVSYEDHQIIPHEDGIGYDILIRMELLTPLLDRMMQKKLDEKEVVKLGIDMCKALEVCHRKNIIHRDIKPQNIFISDTGDYKLGDFGIARTMERATVGMSKKGTYKYMAPEVFRGDHYDSTADLYSLGIVLFSLLNGNRGPFLPAPPAKVTHNDEEEARMRRFRGEPIPAPRDAGVMLSYIIKKACEADPARRYRTAEQMRRDLESYLANYEEQSKSMPVGLVSEETAIDYGSGRYTGSVPPMQQARSAGQYVAQPQHGAHSLYGAQDPYGQYGAAVPVEPREVPASKGKGLKITLIVLAVLLLAGGAAFGIIKYMESRNAPAPEPQPDYPYSDEDYDDDDDYQSEEYYEPENTTPISASATSELEPYTGDEIITYDAYNAIDGDYSTAWVEGVKGPGSGESITVWFENIYPIEAIYIANGYQKNDDVFTGNNRVKEVELTFDDGSTERCTLLDSDGDQVIVLSEPRDSNSVTITIISTYNAADKKDTCITEIGLVDPEYIYDYDDLIYAY